MKQKIKDILLAHPEGLKAKEIATLIPGTDRKDINQILYANPVLFTINNKYEWKLKNIKTKKQEKQSEASNKLQSMEKYCKFDDLPEDVKKQIHSLSVVEYSKFLKNLEELYEDPCIPTPNPGFWGKEKVCSYFVSLALSSDKKILTAKMRSRKMYDLKKESATYFDEWKKITTKTAKEFDSFLDCAKLLSKQRLFVGWFSYRSWFELVNKISKLSNAKDFVDNNNYINENIFRGIWVKWSYEDWHSIVFLPKSELQEFARKFKEFNKTLRAHEHVLNRLKHDEIIQICIKRECDFSQALEKLIKISGIIRLSICPDNISLIDYLKDEKRVNKDYEKYEEEQKKIDRINAISGNYIDPMWIWGYREEKKENKEIRYCTSDCSTCNRESCPYDKN